MSLSSWTSLFFGYLFNEAQHPSEFEFIQRKSFFFSLSVLCAAWLWNSGFFHIPNYVLSFCSTQKATASTNKRQLPSFHSLKNYHVLAFWWFIPQYQWWLRVFFSPLMHTLLIEWGFLMPMSGCTNRDGWRETASLSIANSSLLL